MLPMASWEGLIQVCFSEVFGMVAWLSLMSFGYKHVILISDLQWFCREDPRIWVHH